ncbi:MAG: HAAS signaling domain-containing protein [Thermoanaerobaculia bacterium]
MITPDLQTRIDSYLMHLRRSLGELPPEEINDILREIRGHILERAESSGELTNEKLVSILKALGKPEDIGPLYQAEAMVARARSSFSPALILRTVVRWAMVSLAGFVTFLVGLCGYSTGLAFLICALLKPIFPAQIGAWSNGHNFSIGTISGTNSTELMGWWLIPVCLLASATLLVLTTRFMRWMLRFAIRRRASSVPVEA